jgi:hypothetical protein
MSQLVNCDSPSAAVIDLTCCRFLDTTLCRSTHTVSGFLLLALNLFSNNTYIQMLTSGMVIRVNSYP